MHKKLSLLIIIALALSCFAPLLTQNTHALTEEYLVIYGVGGVYSVTVYDNTYSYGVTITSFPTSGTYFSYFSGDSLTLTVVAQSGNQPFQNWNVSGSISTSNPYTATFGASTYAVVTCMGTSYTYTFYGLYDENSGHLLYNLLYGNLLSSWGYYEGVYVTAYFNNGANPVTFAVNNSATQSTIETFNTQPLYFYYGLWHYYYDFALYQHNANITTQTPNLSDYTNIYREYYLGTTETSGTYYIYASSTVQLSNYEFSIRALGGVSIGNLMTASRIIGGATQIVEQFPIDSLNNVVFALEPNTVYSLTLSGNGVTAYSFGNVVTSTSPIVLTVSALSFPSNVIYQYPYVTIYASRPDSTDILVSYQDLKNQTLSVSYTITDQLGNLVYSASHGAIYGWADDWSGTQANITYYLSATTTGSVFGVSTYSQILAASNAQTTPISLSIFGDWGTIGISNPDQIIWLLIALAVFLCFSALNAYLGGFAGVCVAAFFAWEGWLHIPEATIVTAFCLIFMAILAAWKRPPQYG
jgi:hypothetical protein